MVRPAMSGTVSSGGMTAPISLVRFAPSPALGFRRTFFDPKKPCCRGDDAEHMGLVAIGVDGAADGLAVDGQRAVARAMGLVPSSQGVVELNRIDADQQAAHRRQAGRAVLAVSAAHAETLQHPGAEVVDPFADRLVAAHAAERRSGGERQHRGQGMAPALAAAGIVDALEESGKGSHLCGAERHLRHSMSQAGVEIGGPKRARASRHRG